MTWHESHEYLETMGVVIAVLWLAIPVSASMALAIRRWRRPGTSLIYPLWVLAIWVLVVAIYLLALFGGMLYSESGSVNREAIYATAIAVGLVGIHLSLVAQCLLDLLAKIDPRSGDAHELSD